MKKLGKLHLHDLSKAEMEKREQNMIKGGYDLPPVYVCYCPCRYEGTQSDPTDSYYGGSSTAANNSGNRS
ncbi:TIGR04149 family rSAM-modified RiPP [Parabacteroides sp. Marseille-P3160]|uniref:TIGR04149 family rSAM-modified RiPP n=1 Tax=Parabacteroides sp. Marseille-P3160 TaxID=1917887 RepID=UPI0009BB0BA2|nr:TIGR04149 family rSAM-modified RiPP [Parabacteroides sp. Marseille-P3160]